MPRLALFALMFVVACGSPPTRDAGTVEEQHQLLQRATQALIDRRFDDAERDAVAVLDERADCALARRIRAAAQRGAPIASTWPMIRSAVEKAHPERALSPDFLQEIGVDFRGLGSTQENKPRHARGRVENFLGPDIRLSRIPAREFFFGPPGPAMPALALGEDRHAAPAESAFEQVGAEPISTFSADVDTASYANIRRHLLAGDLPPAGAVRIEEMLNTFRYDYGGPRNGHPFAVDLEVAGCPWNRAHRVVRIGVQAPALEPGKRPACNLVFLLDVSGSMQGADRLGLVRRGLAMLADQLQPKDKVAIVVYAGAAGVALEPTNDREAIKEALRQLEAGGSTAGGEGIRRAYQIARQQFVRGGVNRVVLATDGDFNVGTSDTESLVALIEEQRKSGVFLTVLGVGRGNLNDEMMEKLSNAGNGNYAYLDSIAEARRVLVEQSGGTLVTVAKDVKLQVEFNPARVAAYRLLGYENRRLAARDFDDDLKDAGEIGAGHTVTALYEIVPRGDAAWTPAKKPAGVDALIYGGGQRDELLTLRMRYKQPDGDQSTKLVVAVKDGGKRYARASPDFRFALAVAEFGLRLRGGKDAPTGSYAGIVELAQAGLAPLPNGPRRDLAQRKQLIELIKIADKLSQATPRAAKQPKDED